MSVPAAKSSGVTVNSHPLVLQHRRGPALTSKEGTQLKQALGRAGLQWDHVSLQPVLGDTLALSGY